MLVFILKDGERMTRALHLGVVTIVAAAVFALPYTIGRAGPTVVSVVHCTARRHIDICKRKADDAAAATVAERVRDRKIQYEL